jgi:hypothetical protein
MLDGLDVAHCVGCPFLPVSARFGLVLQIILESLALVFLLS